MVSKPVNAGPATSNAVGRNSVERIAPIWRRSADYAFGSIRPTTCPASSGKSPNPVNPRLQKYS